MGKVDQSQTGIQGQVFQLLAREIGIPEEKLELGVCIHHVKQGVYSRDMQILTIYAIMKSLSILFSFFVSTSFILYTRVSFKDRTKKSILTFGTWQRVHPVCLNVLLL